MDGYIVEFFGDLKYIYSQQQTLYPEIIQGISSIFSSPN